MFSGYIICGTPRTGSTLLCDLLKSTNVAGNPKSFFRRQSISRWVEQWGLPDAQTLGETDFKNAYLKAVIKAGKAGTDVFGLRLMRENLDELSAFLDQIFPLLPSDKMRLEAAFGHPLYIHLTREDKLAQAISLIKAEQTGLWHIAPDGTEIERVGTPKHPEYDFERIHRERTDLERYDAAWISGFDDQKIKPLHIAYETLAVEPAETLARICDALGVSSPSADTIKPGVAKLSDEISADWMRRYSSDIEKMTEPTFPEAQNSAICASQ
ncbi:Stf0 family sulfotransferase [Phyllobacterium sp. 628]|uniref:Stf0 family sulfotransferase n=1 Tax=Phyllobacterium sp. 628 TaxID=2718938 RepID=UPI0016627E50|nr:Stf0 family sulfotransferase [Phyllobacterium sp. 628]